VSLDSVGPGQVRVAVNTTTRHQDAQVRLLSGEQVLYEETTRIGPSQPFSAEISTASTTEAQDLSVEVLAGDAQSLIHYEPPKEEAPDELPAPVEPPPSPEEVETIEQLYLIGRRLDQFHSPTVRPDSYFEEALRRDPKHSRVNTHLGLMALTRLKLDEAEEHLRTAVARVTNRYTRPLSGRSLYYLGVALMRQQQYDDAYTRLYDAAWDKAWYGAAHTLMAQISAQQGRYEQALTHASKALDVGAHNSAAGFLRAVALRQLDRREEARRVVDKVLEDDPLYWPARYERAVLNANAGDVSLYPHDHDRMREEAQNYIDVALAYGKAGDDDTALSILGRAAGAEEKSLSTYPMVHYFRGYYASQSGNAEAAARAYRTAAQMPTDYAFPYRHEAARALREAIQLDSSDARAHLYLGNLYYDTQPDRAIEHWKTARALEPELAVAHRNEAFGYAYARRSYQKAIERMEHALKHAPEDSRYYYEADQYAHWAGRAPTKRLDRLRENHDVVKRDDGALAREVALLTLTGAYDRAIDILSSHHFRRAEGAEGIHDLWVDAHLLRGREALAAGHPQAALDDFNEALRYPKNLEVATSNREGKVHYFIGRAFEAAGEPEQAEEHYNRAVTLDEGLSAPLRYYRALALDKRGREEEADRVLRELVAEGKTRLKDKESTDFFAKFGGQQFEDGQRAQAHYIMGLGYAGLNKEGKARAAFKQAVELDPSHRGAATQLDSARFSRR
jgi:tetratricopeptide (TPR) repeat protein